MDRRTTVWAAVLLVSTCAAARGETLAIRTYDGFGVSASRMTRAQGVATALLAAADVDALWIDCTAPASCLSPVGLREVVVRFVASPSGESRDVLGEALVDRTAHAGVFATIFADHVDAVAARVDIDQAVLLGRTLAHEIGHLLGRSHQRAGLMRSRWSDDELRRQRDSDWLWSTERDPATGTVVTCRAAGAKCVRG